MRLELDPSIIIILVGNCPVCNTENLESVSVDDVAASQADAGATIPRSKNSFHYQALLIAAGKAL